jgi:NitT/TauT family transport system substrate-binding protein/sulfonate transport system substrate-binding protein
MQRRRVILKGISAAVGAGLSMPSLAQSTLPVVRIGYQKFNTLNILKETGYLEKALAPLGTKVEWREFLVTSLVTEAITAGALDIGHASDGIGVFQQAQGKGLAYLASESPYPEGVGFLVPSHSPIKSIRDLKGQKIAIGRGYNTHYLLTKALEANGMTNSDVDIVYIQLPSDHLAAYQAGKVAAVGLWDPFLAAAQVATDSRLLFDGTGFTGNRTYHFAQPNFAKAHRDVVKIIFTELEKANQWAQRYPNEVIDLFSRQLKIPPDVITLATKRRRYGLTALTPAIAREQQDLADVFLRLKLIPKAVDVKEAFLNLDVV